jgi:hypothetical protein
MVKQFKIIVEPPRSPRGYLTGTTMSGNLLVETQEPKNYKHIDVSFVGVCLVESNGPSGTARRGKEEYVRKTVTVWQGDDGTVLSAGVRKFPFSFTIPETCPPSLELGSWFKDGYAAKIKYLLVGRIATRGALKQNHTTETKVTVVQELQASRAESKPVRHTTQSQQGLLSSASRRSEVLTAELPRSTFAVGERIPIRVQLENCRRIRTIDTEAVLEKTVTLKTGGTVFKKPSLTVVKAISAGTWSLEVPAVPRKQVTVQATAGGTLSVTYEVRVKLSLGLAQRLEVRFPVVIGQFIAE